MPTIREASPLLAAQLAYVAARAAFDVVDARPLADIIASDADDTEWTRLADALDGAERALFAAARERIASEPATRALFASVAADIDHVFKAARHNPTVREQVVGLCLRLSA